MSLSIESSSKASLVPVAFFFLLVWIILSDGKPSSWLFGGISILSAVLIRTSLFPKLRKRERMLKVLQLPKFSFYFLRQSITGGVDVALHAISRRITIEPGFVAYPLIHFRQNSPACPFYMNVISVLPGTLSVKVDDDILTIHVLDMKSFNQHDLSICEFKVAQLYGLDIGTKHD